MPIIGEQLAGRYRIDGQLGTGGMASVCVTRTSSSASRRSSAASFTQPASKDSPTPPSLAAAFHEETLAVLTRIGETPLSELLSLAAWRKVLRGFGVDPTQYRSAAEALLRASQAAGRS